MTFPFVFVFGADEQMLVCYHNKTKMVNMISIITFLYHVSIVISCVYMDPIVQLIIKNAS